jgi:hypothetical protein
MPPTLLGKLTTAGQLAFLLGRGPVRAVFAVTAVLSMTAGLDYLRRGRTEAKTKGGGESVPPSE